MADRCSGLTQHGAQCNAKPLPGSDRCPWHTDDPAWAERRRSWSARGGVNRSNRARLKRAMDGETMTLQELHALLSKAARDVVDGTLDVGRANALSTLARSIEAVARSAELEAKIASLESAS